MRSVATRQLRPTGTGCALRIFLFAAVINYPWELAQAHLYRGMDTDGLPWRHCFVASLGDGVLVVVIYLVGLSVSGQRDWFARPRLSSYAVTLATGLSLAVVVERLALSTRRWDYRPSMPILPGIEVCLLPILQMLLLPALVFRLAARAFTRRPEEGKV